MRWAILAAVLGLAGCGGKADPKPADTTSGTPAGKDAVDTAARNRDYFAALEMDINRAIEAHAAAFWASSEARKYAHLNGLEAEKGLRLISDMHSSVMNLYEEEGMKQRKAFIAKHGIDTKDWRPEFKKTFPERDAIFEEIEVAVKRKGRAQAEALSKHLGASYVPSQSKDHDRYCGKYIFDHATAITDEMRDEVRTLGSIAKLRAKAAGR